jgi:hypothetical protein
LFRNSINNIFTVSAKSLEISAGCVPANNIISCNIFISFYSTGRIINYQTSLYNENLVSPEVVGPCINPLTKVGASVRSVRNVPISPGTILGSSEKLVLSHIH